jgi:cystathionine beta-lyase
VVALDEMASKFYESQVRELFGDWMDCRGLGMNDAEMADFMVKKAHLGMNSGASFGREGEGYMRLNAACPRSVLEQALAQLRTVVNGL